MAKRKMKPSKENRVLRELAPRKFGFENIDVVKCFRCNAEQKRVLMHDSAPKGERFVQQHHIFPAVECPELEQEKDNIIFLCSDCHREFHKRFDQWINAVILNGKGVLQQYKKTASINSLQKYLKLSAKKTIADQFEWSEEDRNAAHIK